MSVVTFNADVSPYMKGDTVKLSDDEKKRVDEAVKTRNLKNAYTVASKPAEKKQTMASKKK